MLATQWYRATPSALELVASCARVTPKRRQAKSLIAHENSPVPSL
jgi:hypothetical protein